MIRLHELEITKIIESLFWLQIFQMFPKIKLTDVQVKDLKA